MVLKNYQVWADALNRIRELEAERDALREALLRVGRPRGASYCWCEERSWDCDTVACDEARAALALKEQAK